MTSNSGAQGSPDALVTFHIPLLALTTTALPVLYVLTRGFAPSVFVDFALAQCMAVVLLWAAVNGESGAQRAIAIVGNLALPICLMVLGIRGHEELGRHGYALLILNGLAWLPALMVQEISGPLLVLWHGDPKANPVHGKQVGSCILVILVLVIATLIFAGAGLETEEVPSHTFVVVLFAIPFYLVGFGLLSLARLLRRIYLRPDRPLTISTAFVARWGASLLLLLLACAGLALLLPKFPLHFGDSTSHTQQASTPHTNGWNDRLPPRPGPPLPGQRTTDTPGNGTGTTRTNGHAQGNPDGKQNGTGKSSGKSGSASQKGPSGDAQQSGPGGQPGTGGHGTSGQGGSGGKSGGGQGTGSGKSGSGGSGSSGAGGKGTGKPRDPLAPPAPQVSATAPAPHDPWYLRLAESALDLALRTAYLGEEAQIFVEHPDDFSAEIRPRLGEKTLFLGQAIRHNPLRLLKILIVLLLLPASLLYSIVRTVRGWRRGAVATAAAAPGLHVVPVLDPFADPFPGLEALTPEAQAERVYASFLAYCWLQDYARRPEQTEYEFALWLEAQTHLDTQAVWTLTRGCAQLRYAGVLLSAEELAGLHAAWDTLRGQLSDSLPEAVRVARMATYRTHGIRTPTAQPATN